MGGSVQLIPRDPDRFSAFVTALVQAGKRYRKGSKPGPVSGGAEKPDGKGKGGEKPQGP